ncbi:MAG TPA: DinB family protein [Vicinamibacterales bacterium]|nr:DinB family protein [Vicinamibacterales bacterium]
MTSEQAKAAADLMTTVWEFEFPATCRVLAAVKDDNRDYKPDAKSRTAWDLATHLATTDIWFIDSILNGAFEWDPEAVKRAESQFKTVDDIVAFYTRTFPEKVKALRALPGDTLAATIDCFGNFNWPAVQYIGFANNHSIHHRGQLAAYLRAMGSKVPNIYGPSADDKE